MKWYRTHRRDLPWRNTNSPYAIWISEVMLQQTQVETVIPYYRRFLKRFPALQDLAKARPDSIFRIWQGLGYYRRAEQLRSAARLIVKEHKGQFPKRAVELAKLPGFGPYTAGAVASIAFAEPEPAIDGNVMRVMSRLFFITMPMTNTVVQHRLRPLVLKLMGRAKPGAFNQALMELGALICRPKQPKCQACPLRLHCRARKSGRDLESIPVKKKIKRRKKPVSIAIGIVKRRHQVLIAKRPAGTILGGLWEFPGGKKDPGERIAQTCIRELYEETGLRVRIQSRLDDFVHHYSHYSVHLHFFVCEVSGGRLRRIDRPIKWVALSRLTHYAFPAANRRIIKKLFPGYSSSEL